MTDAFADWDAAYLIGALSPADRALFEEHLGGCAPCRAAVAELAPTAGLLSRVPVSALVDGPVPASTGASSQEPAPHVGEPAPRAARDALIRRVRRGDRRRLGMRIGLVATGVVIVAAVVTLPSTASGPWSVPPVALPTPTVTEIPPAAAMTPLTTAPLTATVRLVGVGWGTRIDLSCRYTSSYGAPDEVYALTVVGRDGATTQLSTWRVVDGADARISAGTALDAASIASVQIRDAAGAVLMIYAP